MVTPKPDPRDLAEVRAANLPRLTGLAPAGPLFATNPLNLETA